MRDIRKSIPGTNYTRGRNRKIDSIVFHHIVGDAGAAIARFRKHGEQASSTYVIGSDGKVYYLVSEGNTPYTNGNYSWNSRSITIEHAGGHLSVPYTEKMYKASIALCKQIRKRHNIKHFVRHRQIVATACPGGLNVERIVKYSNPKRKVDMYKGKVYRKTFKLNAKGWFGKAVYWNRKWKNAKNSLSQVREKLDKVNRSFQDFKINDQVEDKEHKEAVRKLESEIAGLNMELELARRKSTVEVGEETRSWLGALISVLLFWKKK